MQTNSHSFVVHPMLRELRPCSRATGSRMGGNRWNRWAQRLTRRYTRMPARLGALALMLVGRGALQYLINEGWKTLSQRFYPKIKLVVQPILRETLLREQARLLFSLRSESRFVASAGVPALHPTHSTQRRGPSQVSIHRTVVRHRVEHLKWRSWFLESVNKSELMNQNVRVLVERVARQTQRVEERVDERLTLTVRQTSGFAARQSAATTESRKAMTQGLHTTRGTGAGTWAQNTSPPSVNIEALTDQVVQQIDRRMTASRERMGRI